MLSAALTPKGASMEHATPVQVVRMMALNYPHNGGDYHTFSVSSDGERLLYHQVARTGGAGTDSGGSRGPDPAVGFVIAKHWAK
jgi:hypothetical protein